MRGRCEWGFLDEDFRYQSAELLASVPLTDGGVNQELLSWFALPLKSGCSSHSGGGGRGNVAGALS